jgi:hypothetical protein
MLFGSGVIMSMAEIIGALREASHELEQARAEAGSAASRVSRARDVVAQALRGRSTGQLLTLLDTVRGTLQTAADQVEPARQGVLRTVTLAAALELDESDVDHWVEHHQPASRWRPGPSSGVVLVGMFVATAGCAIRRLCRPGRRQRSRRTL